MSAICFSLDQSKILSSGNGLINYSKSVILPLWINENPMHFKMSSVICLNLNQSETLLSGNGLMAQWPILDEPHL